MGVWEEVGAHNLKFQVALLMSVFIATAITFLLRPIISGSGAYIGLSLISVTILSFYFIFRTLK